MTTQPPDPTPCPQRRRCLAALAAWAALPRASQARPAQQGLPLLLAQQAPAGLDPAGYLVSEKLDGVRACWDGVQLRFRSGLPVAAPDWFVKRLPPTALDGELWFGRSRFEALSAAVRRQMLLDAEWRQLRYMVFELPDGVGTFADRARRLATLAQEAAWPQLAAVAQAPVTDAAALQARLAEVLRAGGEGLVLHRADAPYLCGRSPVLLKLKPLHDAEAVVTGHVPGRGRHAGRLGALRVRTPEGLSFFIGTGLSDAQREQPPAPGSVVTYSYRGHTEGGVPRFASFLRMRSD
jgi:DNA ligase-1